MKKLNYIDLFAGCGGLSEGFTASGFHPVAHVEMNNDACLSLKTRECFYYLKRRNKLDVYRSYLLGDITRDELYSNVPQRILNSVINETMSEEGMLHLFSEIDKRMIQQKVSHIDLIVGGPPCQAYSLVGRAVKEDGMRGDPRNYLYKLYIRVLTKYSPQMFVFENVPGLLTANNGKYFNDMQKEFMDAGYSIDYRILNARDFNVLQSRRRIILVGWKNKLNLSYPVFNKKKNNYLVEELLYDLPHIRAGQSNNVYATNSIGNYLMETKIRKQNDVLTWHVSRPNIDRDIEIYKLVIEAWNNDKRRLKYTDLPEELCTHNNKTAFLDRFKVVAKDLPSCHTMMAHISKDGHYFIHPDIEQARSITVREAARIQSFPDDFYFEGSRTAAFTQIGNAVPPLMAKEIAKKIKKLLEKTDEQRIINKTVL